MSVPQLHVDASYSRSAFDSPWLATACREWNVSPLLADCDIRQALLVLLFPPQKPQELVGRISHRSPDHLVQSTWHRV